MSKYPREPDETRIKDRLMKEIERTQDLPTLIGLVGAWTKVRQMELKQEDGDWGAGLGTAPNLNLPPPNADADRSPHRS